jgi:hypothetical protein
LGNRHGNGKSRNWLADIHVAFDQWKALASTSP